MEAKGKGFFAAVLGLLWMVSQGASAGIVYDNGLPNAAGVDGELISSNQLVADDFVLNQNSVITDVHFWTLEPAEAWDGTLVYGIWGDNGGVAPKPADGFANSLAFGLGINITKTLLVSDIFPGYNQYQYDFDIADPLALAGGDRYWLAIYLQAGASELTPNLFWQSTAIQQGADTAGVAANDSSFSWVTLKGRPDMAFYLTGEIPTPSGILLMGLGLVALWAGARRAKC